MSSEIVINSNTYRRNGFGEWADDHGYIIYGGFSDCLDEIERLRAEVERLTDELQQVANEIALAESQEARRG